MACSIELTHPYIRRIRRNVSCNRVQFIENLIDLDEGLSITKNQTQTERKAGHVQGGPSQYKKCPSFRVETPAYMALCNKEQYHSDTNIFKPAKFSRQYTEETNPLYLHISPKDDNRRISSATIKHKIHLQQLPRWDARACQLVVQSSSFISWDTKPETRVCCDVGLRSPFRPEVDNYVAYK